MQTTRIIRYSILYSLALLQAFCVSSFQVAPRISRIANNDAAALLQRQQVVAHSSTVLFAAGKKKKKPTGNVISVNRVARRNYEVLDTIEAGIALTGTEVKSIREGKMNLRDGYVRPSGRSCTLHNVHIGKYSNVGEYFQHEEKRPRELLIHKEQARKFQQQTEQKGMTLIPLKAYFNDKNKVKIEVGLCRGKNVRDKRADIKERDAKREERRIIKSFRI